jgi:hypothetical protein
MIEISNISKSNNLYNFNEKVGANNTSQESQSKTSGINQLKKEAKDTFTKSSELSEKEKRVVEELKRRDQEVRQHEQAHIAAVEVLFEEVLIQLSGGTRWEAIRNWRRSAN